MTHRAQVPGYSRKLSHTEARSLGYSHAEIGRAFRLERERRRAIADLSICDRLYACLAAEYETSNPNEAA